MAEEIKTEIKKKKLPFAIKIIAILAIIFLGFVGLRYWKMKAVERLNSQTELGKLTNIESDLFDLSEEDKNHVESAGLDDSKLSDLTLTELKEGGAEFIYQLLLKNQVQIGDLKGEMQNLKGEFAKYKSQEKAGKIIFTYVDLRQRFFAGDNFSETLKSLETLAILDKNLKEKISQLKPFLEKFHGSENISEKFSALIPDLIATKNNNSSDGIIHKIRHNLSKLVVIRKLHGDTKSVDGIIRTTEEYLHNEDFSNALASFRLLDSTYQEISPEFLEELNAATEVQKIDQDILLYLRGSI